MVHSTVWKMRMRTWILVNSTRKPFPEKLTIDYVYYAYDTGSQISWLSLLFVHHYAVGFMLILQNAKLIIMDFFKGVFNFIQIESNFLLFAKFELLVPEVLVWFP